MKWSDFEKKYPEEIYRISRTLCEEIHKKKMITGNNEETFCNFCYKKEGESCFPCGHVREEYLSRYGFVLDQLLSTFKETNDSNEVSNEKLE